MNDHHKGIRPDRPTRRMNIGLKMQNWHSSQGDPVYAVGSFYFANQEYPERAVVEAARRNLSFNVGKALYSGVDEQRELREIIAYLDGVLGSKSDLPEAASCPDYRFELFLKGYTDQALVSYDADDLSREASRAMREQCMTFWSENGREFCTEENLRLSLACSAEERAGRDFYLTRNDAGAGFGDEDWEETVDLLLRAVANMFGESELYMGDDGKLYVP